MNFKPTYFQTRLDDNEWKALLADRQPFYLENVADVDATTQHVLQALTAQGLRSRVWDQRGGTGKILLVGMLPWPVMAMTWVRSIYRSLKNRLASPNPHAVIIQRDGALDVQFDASAEPNGLQGR